MAGLFSAMFKRLLEEQPPPPPPPPGQDPNQPQGAPQTPPQQGNMGGPAAQQAASGPPMPLQQAPLGPAVTKVFGNLAPSFAPGGPNAGPAGAPDTSGMPPQAPAPSGMQSNPFSGANMNAGGGGFATNGKGFLGGLMQMMGVQSIEQRQQAMSGSADAALAAKIGSYQQAGMQPQQMLETLMQDPVAHDAFVRDPEALTKATQMIQSIAQINTPAVGSAPYNQAPFTIMPGQGTAGVKANPGITGDMGKLITGPLPPTSEANQNMNFSINKGLMDPTWAAKIASGQVVQLEQRDPQGNLTGYQLVDKSDPSSPKVVGNVPFLIQNQGATANPGAISSNNPTGAPPGGAAVDPSKISANNPAPAPGATGPAPQAPFPTPGYTPGAPVPTTTDQQAQTTPPAPQPGAAAAAATPTGGSVGDSGAAARTASPAAPSAAGSPQGSTQARIQDAYGYLQSKYGLSPDAALGMLGNGGRETGFNPRTITDVNGQPSGGLFQWNGPRYTAATAAGATGTDFRKAIDFAMSERQGQAFLARARANPNMSSQEAGQLWMQVFEKTKNPGTDAPKNAAWAEKIKGIIGGAPFAEPSYAAGAQNPGQPGSYAPAPSGYSGGAPDQTQTPPSPFGRLNAAGINPSVMTAPIPEPVTQQPTAPAASAPGATAAITTPPALTGGPQLGKGPGQTPTAPPLGKLRDQVDMFRGAGLGPDLQEEMGKLGGMVNPKLGNSEVTMRRKALEIYAQAFDGLMGTVGSGGRSLQGAFKDLRALKPDLGPNTHPTDEIYDAIQVRQQIENEYANTSQQSTDPKLSPAVRDEATKRLAAYQSVLVSLPTLDEMKAELIGPNDKSGRPTLSGVQGNIPSAIKDAGSTIATGVSTLMHDWGGSTNPATVPPPTPAAPAQGGPANLGAAIGGAKGSADLMAIAAQVKASGDPAMIQAFQTKAAQLKAAGAP